MIEMQYKALHCNCVVPGVGEALIYCVLFSYMVEVEGYMHCRP